MDAQPREAFPFPTAERHDAPTVQPTRPVEQEPHETAIDHGIEESFPASDPVSVNITKVQPAAPLPDARAGQGDAPSMWSGILRTGLAAGALASVFSTAALAWRSWRDVGSPSAGTNAVSHVLWDRESFAARAPSVRHTVPGYLIHHASATLWALLFAWLRGRGRAGPSLGKTLASAGTTAAVAYAIDYSITPERLRPGYEHHLSGRSMALVYGALAAGLLAGCLLSDRRR